MKAAAGPRFPALAEVVDEIRSLIEPPGVRIACLAHKDADADSLGSALGFAESLRAMGKQVVTVVPSPKPRMLVHLPGYDAATGDAGDVDVLFAFDCATVERFGDQRHLVETAPAVVNVDHHLSNDGFGTVQLVDPAASATGQVVYSLLQALDAPVTPDVANNLYAALFTDTGGFRHENTTEAALRLGAELVAHGANPSFIALRSYKWRSLGEVRLEGLAMSRMQVEFDGRLVWSEVTAQMLAETGAELEETEGLIDQLQSLAPMQIAVVFKENGATTKVSVRTRDRFDATTLCTPFGGGGHRRAAGAEIAAPLAEAEQKVLAIAREQLTAPA